jgi:hypothetical protein
VANLTFNTADGYTPPLGSIIPLHFAASAVRTIYPIGVNTSQFGTPTADTALKYVTCNGIDPPNAFGSPQVINLNRYLSAEGTNFTALSQPVIQLFNRTASATGLAATTYGTSSIVNKNLAAKPAGFDAAGYGTAWISTRTQGALTAGSDQALYGTPWVSNKIRTLITHGRVSQEFGNTAVSYKNRTLTLTGFDAKLFGTQFISNQHRTLNLTGYDAALFGTTRLSHNVQEIAPTGFDAAKYGTTRAEYRNRTVLQNSTYSDFGSVSAFAAIGLFSRVLAPSGVTWSGVVPYPRIKVPVLVVGFDASLFGLPSFLPPEQVIEPSGFSDAGHGSLVVTQGSATAQLRHSGFTSMLFGTAVIECNGQWIFCSGVEHLRTGVGRVANGLGAESFANELFGTATISPARQHLYPVGFNALLGVPTISDLVRTIYAVSISQTEIGEPSIRVRLDDAGYPLMTRLSQINVKLAVNNISVHTGQP